MFKRLFQNLFPKKTTRTPAPTKSTGKSPPSLTPTPAPTKSTGESPPSLTPKPTPSLTPKPTPLIFKERLNQIKQLQIVQIKNNPNTFTREKYKLGLTIASQLADLIKDIVVYGVDNNPKLIEEINTYLTDLNNIRVIWNTYIGDINTIIFHDMKIPKTSVKSFKIIILDDEEYYQFLFKSLLIEYTIENEINLNEIDLNKLNELYKKYKSFEYTRDTGETYTGAQILSNFRKGIFMVDLSRSFDIFIKEEQLKGFVPVYPLSERKKAWGESPKDPVPVQQLPRQRQSPPTQRQSSLRQRQSPSKETLIPIQEALPPGVVPEGGAKKKKLNVKELKKMAKDKKIKGYSKMNKAELEKILKKKKK